MAGDMERDARLILRAEDRASRTFDEVAASVKRVRQEIADQTKAMQDGKGDLTAYQRGLEELKRAGDDLIQGQSLIRQFQSTEEAIGRAEDRLKSATAALDAYKAKVGDTPTDNQANQLLKKTEAVTRAQSNLEKQGNRLNELTGRLERAGIATDDLDKEFYRMAAAAGEAAQGIAAAKSAIDDYPDAVKRATAAQQEFAAAQQLAGKDTSFLNPDEFGYVQSLDSARAKLAALTEYEELEARAARAAGAAEKQRRAEQVAGLNEVLRGNAQLEQQFRELAEAEARTKDADAFRQLGTDAAESAVKVERYSASVQSLGNDFQSLSQQVRAGLGGTQSSLQNIDQAFAQIDATAAVLDKPRVKMNELQESAGKLAIAIATLDRTARQIDGFRLQEQAVKSAEASFAEAQAEVLRLARAVGEADEPAEALARELNEAQRALDRAGKEMQQTRNRAVEMGDALRRAGVDTDNLDAEMVRFTASATKAGNAAGQVNGKLKGSGGFLGLNAFQLQNLGYQVNDIFTSIASGGLSAETVFRTLGQQAGQITQIFDGFWGAALRLAPVLLPVAAAVGVLAYNMALVAERNAAIKSFTQEFALAGDGVQRSAVQFAEAQIRLTDLGIKADAAREALRTFNSAGLDAAGLNTFLDTVKAISDATGTDFPAAAEKYSAALTGGYDAVADLNEITHTLSDAQLEEIQRLFDAGDAQKARTLVAEAYRQKAAEIAAKQGGEWKDATTSLGNAFKEMNDALHLTQAASVIARSGLYLITEAARQSAEDIRKLTALVRGFAAVAALARGDALSAAQLAGAAGGNNGATASLFGKNVLGKLPGSPIPRAPGKTRGGQALLRDQQVQLRNAKLLTREERLRNAEIDARNRAAEAGASDPEVQQAAANARAIVQGQLDKEDAADARRGAAASKRKENAAKREAKAAETLANQRRAIEEQLVRDLDGLEAKVDKSQNQSLDERLAAIDKGYTGLFQKLDEFKRKGGTTIEGQSVDAYRASVTAQLQLLKNTETMKFYEEQINDLLKQRADKIKAIEDSRERGDITPASANTQVEEIVSDYGPRVSQIATDALKFAQSLKTAEPNPKLDAFITKLQTTMQQNKTGGLIAKQFAQDTIEEEGKKLDSLISQRDALVAAENTLVELGVKTRTDAQSAIEAAYARTTPLISEQSTVLRGLLSSFLEANPGMQTFYDTWIAKLDAVGAKSEYVSARFTQLKTGIDGIITQAAVSGIDAIAQAFARLALNQQSAVDTLVQIGYAFVNFIASTIQGIAKLIIQMIILDAVQKATGIPIGAFLKLTQAAGLHTGGKAGQERTFGRRVPEIAFANAPRYHGGGVAGFAPNEVPAVLLRNEEVLTEEDPRHFSNLGKGDDGGAGAPVIPQKNILVLDPEELANAMSGPAGEKVVMSIIRRNKTTVGQMVGGGGK